MTRSLSTIPTAAALALAFIAGLYGCGPGSLIVTPEQEAIEMNVDYLMKENSSIKQQLSVLEIRSQDGLKKYATKQELADEKKLTAQMSADIGNLKSGVAVKRADTNADLAAVREEFAGLRGSIEERQFEIERMKESVGLIEETLRSIQQRLSLLETGAPDVYGEGPEREGAMESINANISTIEEELASLREKIASIEQTLAEDLGAAAAPPAAEPDPAAVYMQAYQDTMDKDYPKAMATFKSFLTIFPDHELADNAQYWVGEIYYAEGDFERAVLEFNKVIKNYPSGDKVAAALLKQGFSFRNLGALKEAEIILKRVVNNHPESREAERARQALEKMEEAKGP